jgi:hypothetical protein
MPSASGRKNVGLACRIDKVAEVVIPFKRLQDVSGHHDDMQAWRRSRHKVHEIGELTERHLGIYHHVNDAFGAIFHQFGNSRGQPISVDLLLVDPCPSILRKSDEFGSSAAIGWFLRIVMKPDDRDEYACRLSNPHSKCTHDEDQKQAGERRSQKLSQMAEIHALYGHQRLGECS